MAIVRGITTQRGRDRERAIAFCGAVGLVAREGNPQLAPMFCRDRMCAHCQMLRSRKLAMQLRTFWVGRVAELGAAAVAKGVGHWFVTLTPPKPGGSDPEPALDKMRDWWRELTNSKTAQGREFHRRFDGGLRSFEVTWSPKGKLRKDGTRVKYSGWHAHAHLILEGGDCYDLRWLLRRWCELTDGNYLAQHYAPLDERRIGQCAKYVVKPLDDDCPLPLARKLACDMHGRRFQDAFGSWRGWKATVKEPSADEYEVAWDTLTDRPVSFVELFRRVTAGLRPGESKTVAWRVPGEKEIKRVQSVESVWRELKGWAHASKEKTDNARANAADVGAPPPRAGPLVSENARRVLPERPGAAGDSSVQETRADIAHRRAAGTVRT